MTRGPMYLNYYPEDFIPANPVPQIEPTVRDRQITKMDFTGVRRPELGWTVGTHGKYYVINLHADSFDAAMIEDAMQRQLKLVPAQHNLLVLIDPQVYADEMMMCDQFGLDRRVSLEAELKTGQFALTKEYKC